MRAHRSIALALALGACAPTLPAAWHDAMASGDRAHHAGREAEAAAQYDQAAREAARSRDRDEAEFRSAMSLARTGDRAGALARLDGVASRSPDFERGARASYEAAMIRCASNDESERARGWRDLDTLVRTRSETGPARVSIERLLAEHEARDPSLARAIAWIDEALADARLTAVPLRASLQAERARRLERAGRGSDAVAAWRALFVDIPYPQNNRWDDGHVALATLLRTQGDARGAAAALEEMLSVVDPSCNGGTCDAPEMQEGAMLRAEILRDDLRDLAGAAAAFHRAYEMFPSSRVRDDALEGEARVRDLLRDGSACAVWVRLASEFPCTRRGRLGRGRATECGRPPEAPASDACE